MRCAILCAVLLALLAVGASASCEKFCYAGEMSVGATGKDKLSYSFTILPCEPARVLRPVFKLNGKEISMPATGAKYVCKSFDGIAKLGVEFGIGRGLVWNYQTTESCDEINSNLNTINGVYSGSDHSFDDSGMLGDEDLTSHQIQCDDSSCVAIDYASGDLQFAGLALDKSPCGDEGNTECTMNIQFQTKGACNGALSAEVTGLQVVMQPGNVLLSSYQPTALLDAKLNCFNQQLTLQSAGVSVSYGTPTDNAADCQTLLSDLSLLATARATEAVLLLDNGEMWTADFAPSISNSAATSNGGSNTDDLPSQPHTEAVNDTRIRRAIEPNVFCQARKDIGNRHSLCCTVFGFTNPNYAAIQINKTNHDNFINPRPDVVNSAQPTMFPAATTVTTSFGHEWDCTKTLSHQVHWTVKTRGTNPRTVFQREAVSYRERNDCGSTIAATYCPSFPLSGDTASTDEQ